MQRRPDEQYPPEEFGGQPPLDPVNPAAQPPVDPGYTAQPYTMEPGYAAQPDQPLSGRPSPAYDRGADTSASEQMADYAQDRDTGHATHHQGLDTSHWLKLSELANRPIVDLTNGAKLGQLDDLVLGDDHSRVVGFATQGKILHGPAAYPVQDATIGSDAITLPAGSLQGFDEQRMKGMPLGRPLVGMRLLSTTGNILGQIKDVRFDPKSWAVAYEIEGAGNLLQRLFHPGTALPASAIQSYGQDAIIVGEAAAEQYLGSDR